MTKNDNIKKNIRSKKSENKLLINQKKGGGESEQNMIQSIKNRKNIWNADLQIMH
jgi:hypothetical protein